MSKKHPKMPIEARAKQFMPFAAVTGLEAALEKKLQEYLAEKEKEKQEDDMTEQSVSD